jgi:hypothetical protein
MAAASSSDERFSRWTLKRFLDEISRDPEVLRVPGAQFACLAAMALLEQHADHKQEASNYLRRAEEARTQIMSQYGRKAAIAEDIALLATAPSRVNYAARDVDTKLFFEVKNLEYKPNLDSAVTADLVTDIFPEIALSCALPAILKFSVEAQNHFRDATIQGYDLLMAKFHDKLTYKHHDVAVLFNSFRGHAGGFIKYLRAVLHYVSQTEGVLKTDMLHSTLSLLEKCKGNQQVYKEYSKEIV